MDFIGAGSSIIGGLLGGVFRLVPEVFKFFDAKNERQHELDMQDKQLEFAKLQGGQQIQEAQIQQDTVDIGALKDVLVAQSALTGNKFIDGLNASVRPFVTYMLLCLYLTFKYSLGYTMYNSNMAILDIAKALYTTDDQALLWGIINFWFLDRVIKSRSS
jgi:hypothetical protein